MAMDLERRQRGEETERSVAEESAVLDVNGGPLGEASQDLPDDVLSPNPTK